MQPLVSCVIPVYNGARYLGEAIDSALGQSYPAIEVLVVDDGSTDDSGAVAAAYGERVRYFRQENAGPPAARNTGVREARGEVIAFLDSDDLWHGEKIERQVAQFQVRPELDGCLCHAKLFWIDELREEGARYESHPRAQPPGYGSTTLMARRELFRKIGDFDPKLRFGDLIDWFLRVQRHGALFEMLPDVLAYRRMHHTNLSRQAHGRAQFVDIVKSALDRKRTT
ncbi:MAG: glycosyltransferase family A protein [Gemmatimonadaceae bacterium]